MRNCHATMINKELGKPFSLNTVHGCIQKCDLKLHHTRRKPYISSVQNHGPVLEFISDGQKDSGHVFCGQRSPCFSCFWEKLTSASTKMRKSIQAVIRERFKASVRVGMGVLHGEDETISMNVDQHLISVMETEQLASLFRMFQVGMGLAFPHLIHKLSLCHSPTPQLNSLLLTCFKQLLPNKYNLFPFKSPHVLLSFLLILKDFPTFLGMRFVFKPTLCWIFLSCGFILIYPA